VSEGLKRYPNSPELKTYLAFSLSMVNRISKDENERKEAVEKAIKMCEEVVDTCGDIKQVNNALNMLTRIYNETGDYKKAEECIAKISADCYSARIVGMVNMLGYKKCYSEQEQYAEESLWKLYWTMSHIFENMTHTFKTNGKYEKALAFFDAHEKLLSIFDFGCPDFHATYKIFACENKAHTYMKLGDKEKCIAELRRFFELAKQVKDVASSSDLNIAKRNPVYFSSIKEEILEEYMPNIYPEKALSKYDKFFGEDEEYNKFKREVL
ncbi:MAG: tetratricopeptide repeat protein, partial [Clostridia bacterium]|nr:tetratricopeptide repeat protein [Clostridia bacterium]